MENSGSHIGGRYFLLLGNTLGELHDRLIPPHDNPLQNKKISE